MSVLVEDAMRAALHRRTMSGHLDWLTVGTLVQSHGGAVAGVEAQCRRTGLHIAVSEDKAEYVRLLVARGADVSARCGLGLTPLLLAVVRGHADSVDALLALGAGGAAGDGEGPGSGSGSGGAGELDACICIGRYLGHARIVDALLLRRALRSPRLPRGGRNGGGASAPAAAAGDGYRRRDA
jgi:hypothetical protein